MITPALHPARDASPAAAALSVHVPTADQFAAFDQQLANRHCLGAGRPAGDYLRQIVERDGQAFALLVWGPACYALKDRDRWISWSVNQRLERLKLLVQNRRFLLLTPKGAAPNLAGQPGLVAQRAAPRDGPRTGSPIPAATARTPPLPSLPRPQAPRHFMTSKQKTLVIESGGQAAKRPTLSSHEERMGREPERGDSQIKTCLPPAPLPFS